jgi:AcrR family transcriptional regulator
MRRPLKRRGSESKVLVAPASYRGVSLDERRALRRERLIAAAVDLYGERGYRDVTVRMICQRARLTERYFYESFASNEDILVVAARTLAARTHDWMRRLRDGVDGDRDAKTLRMLTGYYRSQSEEPTKARVFTLEFRGISAAADAEFERILDMFAELIVETRDPLGRGRAANDRLVRRGVVGGVLQITISWIESGYREPIDRVVDAAAHVCSLADPS